MIKLKKSKEGIEAFELRVLNEEADLNEKIEKLEAFTKNDKFNGLDDEMKDLMSKQLIIMKGYHQILVKRLDKLGFKFE